MGVSELNLQWLVSETLRIADGNISVKETIATGVVQSYNLTAGFGFIELQDRRRAFIHSSVMNKFGINDLPEGLPITVSFGNFEEIPVVIRVINPDYIINEIEVRRKLYRNIVDNKSAKKYKAGMNNGTIDKKRDDSAHIIASWSKDIKTLTARLNLPAQEIANQAILILISQAHNGKFDLINQFLAAAKMETVTPPKLTKSQLASFQRYAEKNRWESESGISPSDHIAKQYKRWLKIGLPLAVIRDVQANLASAYATEISRDPMRRVEGVYVRPNKLPAGAPIAPKASRRMADMTEEEQKRKRAQNVASQARFRTKRSDPKP